MLLVTTAMKPASDFTTPRRLIALISRHFFPVEQPDPPCCTTGLKNGSRFPFIAHFFSSALGLAGSPGFAAAGVGAATAAATVLAGPFASFLASIFGDAAFAAATLEAGAAFEVVTAAAFGADAGAAFATAAFAGAGADCASAGDPPCVCRISVNLPAGPA